MTKDFGSLGGRDDVHLPGDLPDLGRWRPLDGFYHEADELGRPDEFPTRGVFLRVALLDRDGQPEHYVGGTEGLEDLIETWLAEEAEEPYGLMELTVDVETAEKAGGEETSPWRFTASIVPFEQVGPPE